MRLSLLLILSSLLILIIASVAPKILIYFSLILLSLHLLLISLFHFFFRRPAAPTKAFHDKFTTTSFEKWTPEWISACAEFMKLNNRLGESIFTLVNHSQRHLQRNRVVSVVVHENTATSGASSEQRKIVAVAFYYLVKVIAGYEVAVNMTIPMLTGCAYTVAVDKTLGEEAASQLKREISQAIVDELSAKYKVIGVAAPLVTDKHSTMSSSFVKFTFLNYNYLDLSLYKSEKEYLSANPSLDKKMVKYKRQLNTKHFKMQTYSNSSDDLSLDTLDFERLSNLTKIISYKRGSDDALEMSAQMMKALILDSPKDLNVKVVTVEHEKTPHRVNGFFLSLTENSNCEEQHQKRHWALVAGLDYESLKGTSAYRVLMYHVIQSAVNSGVTLLNLGMSNDDIKAEFGCDKLPYDLHIQACGPSRILIDSLAFLLKLRKENKWSL